MNRRVLGIALVVAMAACGGEDGPTAPPLPTLQPHYTFHANVTVTIPGTPPGLCTWTGPMTFTMTSQSGYHVTIGGAVNCGGVSPTGIESEGTGVINSTQLDFVAGAANCHFSGTLTSSGITNGTTSCPNGSIAGTWFAD